MGFKAKIKRSDPGLQTALVGYSVDGYHYM